MNSRASLRYSDKKKHPDKPEIRRKTDCGSYRSALTLKYEGRWSIMYRAKDSLFDIDKAKGACLGSYLEQ